MTTAERDDVYNGTYKHLHGHKPGHTQTTGLQYININIYNDNISDKFRLLPTRARLLLIQKTQYYVLIHNLFSVGGCVCMCVSVCVWVSCYQRVYSSVYPALAD